MRIVSKDIEITIENFYNDHWDKNDCIIKMHRNESFVASSRSGKNLTIDEMSSKFYDFIKDRNITNWGESIPPDYLSDSERRDLKIEFILCQ